MNRNHLILSLAFVFSGLTAAHGATNVSFDSGVEVEAVVKNIRAARAAVAAKPAASDKGELTGAGVELMVDVVKDGYGTSWQERRRHLFGPYAPVDVSPGDLVTLSFKSTAGTTAGPYGDMVAYTTALSVSFAPDAEASSTCGSGQQMLKLESEYKGSVSPSSLCLPRAFDVRATLVRLDTTTDKYDLPVTFKLTVTPKTTDTNPDILPDGSNVNNPFPM